MEFHRWASIENLELELEKETEDVKAAKTLDCHWVATEKIDGTNIGINVSREGVRISSRNNMLAPETNFFNVKEHLNLIGELIFKLKAFVSATPKVDQITLNGEYYGQQVMNRIKYGVHYAFAFFGAYSIDEGEYHLWPYSELDGMLKGWGLGHLLVPMIGIYDSFDEACRVPNDVPSQLNPKETAEGIVIEPFELPWKMRLNEMDLQFIFKSKNEKFRERTADKINLKPSDKEDNAIRAFRRDFQSLCTESRMWSVLSKIGRPDSPKDFSPYVGPFLSDAWEDFLKMHPNEEFSSKDRKAIQSIGGLGFKLFNIAASKMLKDGE